MDLSGYTLAALHQDGEFVLYRGRAATTPAALPPSVLVWVPASEHPVPARVRMLERELALRDDLNSTWVLRPLGLAQYQGRVALILEDQQGEPLDRLLETPMDLGLLLKLAVGLSTAVGEVHRRGVIHKNIKPAHVLANVATGQVWLTGFGIASRLPRERLGLQPLETIAGTLAYMAPEQTGRMNRSIDGRSDLYALGVTLYQMLTGSLPFTAVEPIEWVHCHMARRPPEPSERVSNVPAAVSAIIMKLLAKNPEDRYHTAAGLERDLRRCRAQFESDGRIDAFALGTRDTPDRLLIPEKLYGRQREVEILLASFDRIVKGGAPELVLVSGYSGIGKSSVVNELHKVLVPPRGLFAAGKFDQYKRDIPYSTLAQAFQDLVRPLLGTSEGELARWRDALRNALGPNAQLIVDLVPELKLIIGDQAPVAELPPQDAQRRFQLVFRRFLGVFARPEHPLALFLDDLQWLDAATLELLEDIVTQPELRHLLLIGAYRDNEVTSTHPLMRALDDIRSAGTRVREIRLAPLTHEDVGQLIVDSLYCGRERAASLAQLTIEKTDGNPFFVIQFLSVMADEGLLTFDHPEGRWLWDLSRIHAKGYTANVVDLMIGKVGRLPIVTQEVLQQFACLGNSAECARLAMVCEVSKQALDRDVDEALRAGLVLPAGDSYRFLHDRVQEAAYSQIPEAKRAETHLRIGRLLAEHTPTDKQEEAIFEIVNQLNRGAALITSRDETESLAQFNLMAGRRAKASTAYVSALTYLVAGADRLGDDGWERRPDLMLPLELNRAECELLTGELAAAEERLTRLVSHAIHVIDQAKIACLRIDLYMMIDRNDRALDVCRAYMHYLDIEWSPDPTEEEARREYDRTWSLLGGREIETLIDLPAMNAPAIVATLDVLTKTFTPALYSNENLLCLIVCQTITLSLEHGNSDGSCLAYVWLGRIAGYRFGNYSACFRFGRLGYDLVERSGMERFKARTYITFGNYCVPWVEHVRSARGMLRRAFDAASRNGDLPYAAFSYNNLVANLFAAGDPLVDVQREAEGGLVFARGAGFGGVIDLLTTQLGLVRTLRGLTATFGSLNDAQFDELRYERNLSSGQAPGAPIAACRYWIRKLQARFFAGDHLAALEASSQVRRLLWTMPTTLEIADYHLYSALSHAASCDAATPAEHHHHLEALTAHHRQFVAWAEHCRENFQHRAALVGAETARVEGRELHAERLYEEAIRLARENGFVHHEALANELAARFYAARGFETISTAYLRNARYDYLRWGAEGKVRQLEQLYPHPGPDETGEDRTGTIGVPLEQLDLTTVIKVSQAVSGEVVFERLLDTLMRTAMEHAGAERALLFLPRGTEQRVAAEARTSSDAVVVRLCDEPVTAAMLPETVFRYVLQTQQSVLLNDAALLNPFSTDSYLAACHARSILCVPLTNQARLIGVLYLENTLAPDVFAPARIAVLKLLASQAAISLDNTRLYRDLQEREARVRRLMDANIIGVFMWHADGRVASANDELLRIIGYSRDDVDSGRLRWTDFTLPEWRELDIRMLEELRHGESHKSEEREYLRKDGTRVPVLTGGTMFEGVPGEGLAFVVDLTASKRAEEALARAGAELAHVSRVTALSALTASIAHEVNQPLAGIITNAGTCLRMLDAVPPDIDGARDTARRTIRDGNRASEVIARLRSLFSKREFTLESLDLNETAREVLALLSGDLQRNQITIQADLADDLPIIAGDRIQLQQVVLNLVRNASDAMADVDDRQRQLLITTAREDSGRVRLGVGDVGVGLSPSSLDSLFDPFYTTKSGGMGIGLFVSRSIIERHHGRLWAEPNQGRPGATFSFSIPNGTASLLTATGKSQTS